MISTKEIEAFLRRMEVVQNNYLKEELKPDYHSEAVKEKLIDDVIDFEELRIRANFLYGYFNFLGIENDTISISYLLECCEFLNMAIDDMIYKISISDAKGVNIKSNFRTSRKEPTTEKIHQKLVLQLILKTSENILFDTNNSAIADALERLTGFSTKNTKNSLSEKDWYKVEVYDTAIDKLKTIIAQIEAAKEKLPPRK